MDDQITVKFCPVIQTDCKREICHWWIDLSGVATYSAGKAPGECAIKSLAQDLRNLPEKGIKVSALQGVFKDVL